LAFAREVIRLCRRVTVNPVTRDLISQVVRASSSVGANYREANDALSKKDFGHRIKIVRREAKEAHYWLQLLEEAVPELDGEVAGLLQEALELKKIFSSIAEKTK
jgi:four helix bundle protein